MDDAFLRLSLAALFGALIGVERQWRHKNAGIKTNTLVALGAAGFAIMSNSFGTANHNPGQLAAAVVTGIGFGPMPVPAWRSVSDTCASPRS